MTTVLARKCQACPRVERPKGACPYCTRCCRKRGHCRGRSGPFVVPRSVPTPTVDR